MELLARFVVQMRTDSRPEFSEFVKITNGPSIKAFLGLQQLVVHRYQEELERLCERVFGQELLSIEDLDHVHQTMHSYCE